MSSEYFQCLLYFSVLIVCFQSKVECSQGIVNDVAYNIDSLRPSMYEVSVIDLHGNDASRFRRQATAPPTTTVLAKDNNGNNPSPVTHPVTDPTIPVPNPPTIPNQPGISVAPPTTTKEPMASQPTEKPTEKPTTEKPTTEKPTDKPTTTPDPTQWDYRVDDHAYYKSQMTKVGNIDDFWMDLEDVQGHGTLSNSHRTAVTADLKFEFRFYGHVITNITIATGGFLYMSPFLHQWLTATQYIAPLMANFDTQIGDQSEIMYFNDNYHKFIVEWRDVHLQDQNTSTSFRFQAILHNNGSIVFVYKKLPLPIKSISSEKHPVKIGLSDAFYSDTTGMQGSKRRTIYEYHRVALNTSYISEGTVVMIHPLPTCNLVKDCETCVTQNIGFSCKWCGIVQRCSDSVDWHRQQWIRAGCIHLSGDSNCSAIVTAAPTTKKPSKNYTDYPDNDQGSDNVAVIIIVVVIVVVLLAAAGGWFYYAYAHPTSASGMWLMEHRPSQMKQKMQGMKFWKRDAPAGEKYAVESTA